VVKEGEQFGLGLYVLEVFKVEVKEIENWIEEAKKILDVKNNEEFDFEKVEELYKDSKRFSIESEEVEKFQQAFQPIISWAQEANLFIENQSTKSKGKAKKQLDALSSGLSSNEFFIKIPKDINNNFTPYEIVLRLVKFFEEKKEEVKIEVDVENSGNVASSQHEGELDNKEVNYQPQNEADLASEFVAKDVPMAIDEQKEPQNSKIQENKNAEFIQQEIYRKQDPLISLEELMAEDEPCSREVQTTKIFKIELAKPEDREMKDAEGNLKLKTYHEIDDLLNENGDLKQLSPHLTEIKEDKELIEKLDILMKDCRGRSRKSKNSPKKIISKVSLKPEKLSETSRDLECNILPKTELSPPNSYWLNFK
jgi:hypothetical protein